MTQYDGGARIPETTISSNTTLNTSHEMVFVDTTAGAVTASLPLGTAGRVLGIQRITGSNDLVIFTSSNTIRAGGFSGLNTWKITDNVRHGLIYRTAGSEWVAEA